MTRVVLVPGVLALLPEYAGLEDPVAELRAACLAAVRWLGADPVVLADPQGERVGRALLRAAGGFETVAAQPPQPPAATVAAQPPQPPAATGSAQPPQPPAATGSAQPPRPPAATVAAAPPARVLVVGNGSARRTEKAPGFLDERARGFDDELGASLRAGRPRVDAGLAAELWASVAGIERLADLGDLGPAQVDYDDDPFGVQYWVLRWGS